MFKSNKMINESNNGINKINGVMSPQTAGYAGPVNWSMGDGVIGSYDNLQLQTQCSSKWAGPPCNPPIKSNLQWVPQGTPLPLKEEMIYSTLPKDSMNIFAKTYFSPSCCENTSGGSYSSDRGCACLTQEQTIGFGLRGGNSTYNNYNF